MNSTDGIILLVVGMLFLTIFGIFSNCVNLAFQPIVQVSINEKIIFKGSNACVSTKTGGANTNVDIYGGFLCLFPQETYSSKNIEITTVLTVP
jgi:hypothetical protein